MHQSRPCPPGNPALNVCCWLWQNLVGLVPLALVLGELTEDLAIRFGDVVGGLLVRMTCKASLLRH